MQATCLTMVRKVEGRSTFLATHNATIAVAKWGVTDEFFLASFNAAFVALQESRKIASCNKAFRETQLGSHNILDLTRLHMFICSNYLYYCPAGVLLRKLENGLHGISHVVVDEIHERDINVRFGKWCKK